MYFAISTSAQRACAAFSICFDIQIVPLTWPVSVGAGAYLK